MTDKLFDDINWLTVHSLKAVQVYKKSLAIIRGHSKSTSLGKSGGGWQKRDKSGIEGGGAAKKVMSLIQNFSVPIFSATQFLLLYIYLMRL